MSNFERRFRPGFRHLGFLSLALLVALPSGAQLSHDAVPQPPGPPPAGPVPVFDPQGTLYDNDVSDVMTSVASQDSSGTFTARAADDFVLDGAVCPSGLFEITRVRAQMVQQDAAPQPFGIEIYADNGSGTAPTPANAIVPIASATETSQTNLGAFGAGTSLFEASFDTAGLELAADTVFWISSFGATGASNPSGFNSFFATSAGAPTTSANGVVIAPDAGVAEWTPVQNVIGDPARHFSFSDRRRLRSAAGACVRGPDALDLGARWPCVGPHSWRDGRDASSRELALPGFLFV